MKFLFNLLLFSLPFDICCQTLHLSGTIVDKGTQAPVAMVAIFTKDKKTGTVSTAKGKFSLNIPVSQAKTYLYFATIGYETDSVLIDQYSSPVSVRLTPKAYSLKEVYVIPDSTLLTLLRRAYNKIPENYPNQPTRYTAFFQETTSNEESLSEIIEAELLIYKESYQKKREAPGQVEIVKSRIKQFQNTETRFSGGAFVLISHDVILQRVDYIDPKKMQQYAYQFDGVSTFNGRDCYKIEFHSGNKDDDKSVDGIMLIDSKTLAYVSFEVNSLNKSNKKIGLGLVKPFESNGKITYEQHDDSKWYMTRVSYKMSHDNWRLPRPLFSSVDAIITQIQTDSVYPIPIEKRLEYADPIESKAETYRPEGWTDYDILANQHSDQLGFQFSTDESSTIFQQKTPLNISFTQIVTNLMPKLILSYGISYMPVAFGGINTNIRFQPDPDVSPFLFSENISNAKANFLLQGILGYKINKQWHLFWQSSSYNIFSKDITSKSNSLGVKYQKNLNNAGYPLFFGVSFLVNDRSYYRNLGSRENPDIFTYNHTKFNAKALNFSYGTREQTVTPRISLSKRMSKYITMDIYANYHYSIHSKNYFKIEEKGGFFSFFKKSTTLNFNDSHLMIDNPNMLRTSISPNRFEAGFVISLF